MQYIYICIYLQISGYRDLFTDKYNYHIISYYIILYNKQYISQPFSHHSFQIVQSAATATATATATYCWPTAHSPCRGNRDPAALFFLSRRCLTMRGLNSWRMRTFSNSPAAYFPIRPVQTIAVTLSSCLWLVWQHIYTCPQLLCRALAT